VTAARHERRTGRSREPVACRSLDRRIITLPGDFGALCLRSPVLSCAWLMDDPGGDLGSPSIPSSGSYCVSSCGPDQAPVRCDVLHLSSPHLSEIPAGRHR
jgi:hypothetical protein